VAFGSVGFSSKGHTWDDSKTYFLHDLHTMDVMERTFGYYQTSRGMSEATIRYAQPRVLMSNKYMVVQMAWTLHYPLDDTIIVGADNCLTQTQGRKFDVMRVSFNHRSFQNIWSFDCMVPNLYSYSKLDNPTLKTLNYNFEGVFERP